MKFWRTWTLLANTSGLWKPAKALRLPLWTVRFTFFIIFFHDFIYSLFTATLLALSSKKVRRAAEDKRKHQSLYDDDKYQDQLRLKLKNPRRERGWIDLGKKFKHVFRKPVHLEFLHGGVDKKPIEDKIPIPRKVPTKKSNEPVVVSKYITHTEKTARAQMKGPTVDRLCLSVADQLISICEKQRRINLFEFTVHPDSFTQTVQNLFLTSFLVKKRQAKIYMKDGVPYIKHLTGDESRKKGKGQGDDDKQSQVIINITKKQWQKLVQTLDLKEPVLNLPK